MLVSALDMSDYNVPFDNAHWKNIGLWDWCSIPTLNLFLSFSKSHHFLEPIVKAIAE